MKDRAPPTRVRDRKRVRQKCLECGEVYLVPPDLARRYVTCSSSCSSARKRRLKLGAANPAWRGERAGYFAIHLWLSKHYPKSGVCEECGVSGVRTEYAFLRRPAPYTRERGDYAELCCPCHQRLDGYPAAGKRRKVAA